MDANWDLYNYHLYNPFALLEGKRTIDFAPAGMQTYFNPLLDLPYFLAIQHLPPALVGFAMGFLHGIAFILLAAIACNALHDLPGKKRNRTAIVLALAGVLTANFLSELGNTMGDNTTALFVLGGIALLARRWQAIESSSGRAAVASAGALIGIAAGLKPTNATYAIAACIALLAAPLPAGGRLRVASLYACAAVAGFAAAAGYWSWTMWSAFGNPLFPQFGNLFPNPLAAAIAVGDTSWRPRGVVEGLLWPFVISLDAKRVGQQPLHQVVWAVAYALFIGWGVIAGRDVVRRRSGAALSSINVFLLTFVGAGFLAWTAIFSIYRYLVPIELLAPLAIFVLCRRIFVDGVAEKAAATLLAFSTLVVVAGGVKTWGHNGWTAEPYRIDVPPLADPSRATAVIVGEEQPMAWLAIGFPAQVAFTEIGGNFPEGPAFRERIRQIVERRGGSAHAIVQGHYDASGEREIRLRRILASLGLTSGERSCRFLQSAVRTLRLRAEVTLIAQSVDGRSCDVILPVGTRRDIDAENHAAREAAAAVLSRYGFQMRSETCTLHEARLGDAIRRYQWCAIS